MEKLTEVKYKIAQWLIGPVPRLAAQVEQVYEAIWPKHTSYEAATKSTLLTALFKAHLYGIDQQLSNKYMPLTKTATGKKGGILVVDDIEAPPDSEEKNVFEKEWFHPVPDSWLIWNFERGQWWTQSRHGYTPSREEAGRFSLLDAIEIVKDANIQQNDQPEEAMVPDGRL